MTASLVFVRPSLSLSDRSGRLLLHRTGPQSIMAGPTEHSTGLSSTFGLSRTRHADRESMRRSATRESRYSTRYSTLSGATPQWGTADAEVKTPPPPPPMVGPQGYQWFPLFKPRVAGIWPSIICFAYCQGL